MNLFFLIVAGFAVASALSVLFARQPVHAVLGLVAHFITLSVLYLSLSAEFLAAIQTIIYGGGIMILFLFVVTLLPARPGLGEPIRQLPWLPVLTVAASILILTSLSMAIARAHLSPFPVAPSQLGSISNFGLSLLTVHVVPFELTALILLTAVIGVVVLVGGRAFGGNR